MNKQLRHVSVAALILLAALIVSTTYWQTWAVGEPRDRQGNAIAARSRGSRSTAARSSPPTAPCSRRTARHRKHGLTIFTRHYPQNDLAPQVVGYATNAGTTTGLEQSLDDYLTGANTNLSNTFKQELDRLGGQTVNGRQRVPHAASRHPAARARPARQPLRRGRGARREDGRRRRDGLVAHLQREPHGAAERLQQGQEDQGHLRRRVGARQNNATAGLYPPGSTFKMVTAAAALDSGAYTPSSPFYDPGYCTEYGQQRLELGQPGPERAGGLRQRHARAGLRALDQLGLLQRRQAHRRRGDPQLREAVRLLLAAAARHAADERARVRPLQVRQAR